MSSDDAELKPEGEGELIVASPPSEAVVEGIFVATAAGEPMKELASAEVIAQRGIVGDRYMRRQGTYSLWRNSEKKPGQREPGRQVTIVAAEGVETALIMNGIAAFNTVGDLRRNIVTRGVPAAELQAAVGHEIRLGDEVVLFAHRSCVPCMYNERKSGRPGLMEAVWDVAGVNCEVVQGGTLRAGDAVRIVAAHEPERVDGGSHPPAFFVPPSKRTRPQVLALQQRAAAVLPGLLQLDPGGVARALESYQSVGLQLFKRPKRFRRAEVLQERFCTMIGLFFGLMVILYLSHHGERLHGEFVAWLRVTLDPYLGPYLGR